MNKEKSITSEPPQSVALFSLKENIKNAINTSTLPSWMIVDGLELILNDIRTKANAEIMEDAKEWNSENEKQEV